MKHCLWHLFGILETTSKPSVLRNDLHCADSIHIELTNTCCWLICWLLRCWYTGRPEINIGIINNLQRHVWKLHHDIFLRNWFACGVVCGEHLLLLVRHISYNAGTMHVRIYNISNKQDIENLKKNIAQLHFAIFTYSSLNNKQCCDGVRRIREADDLLERVQSPVTSFSVAIVADLIITRLSIASYWCFFREPFLPCLRHPTGPYHKTAWFTFVWQ